MTDSKMVNIENKTMSHTGISVEKLHKLSCEEIGHIIRRAIVNGINVFDMCAGGDNVYAPVGKAIEHVRDHVVLTAHFGADFDELGEYEWIRDAGRIKRGFCKMLKEMGTDHIDIGLLHFVDDEDDWRALRDDGVLGYMKRLKRDGLLRQLGFFTDSPALAMKLLDSGEFGAILVRYDECNDAHCLDELMERCQREKITVLAVAADMKERSTPAVATSLASVTSLDELDALLEQI